LPRGADKLEGYWKGIIRGSLLVPCLGGWVIVILSSVMYYAGLKQYPNRYDHRDIGYSTDISTPYDIFLILYDVLAVLDAFQAKAAHLIGHSMSGYLAELAAVHRPSRVLFATVISSGPTVTPSVATELRLSAMKQETWEAVLSNRPTGDWASDLPGWMRGWRLLHGSHELDEEMAVRYTHELYTRDVRDASVAERHIAAMGTVPAELADDLRRVTAPGLVIHGTEDPLVPVDHGMATARLIPGCRFRPLPGAGHMLFHGDLWGQLATLILTHVRAAGRGSADDPGSTRDRPGSRGWDRG
jgi:pimeloyl-ACP methyl ester carboxylesterase